jgi:hypothetical protein
MRQEEILVDSMLNMFAALELATVRIGDDPQLAPTLYEKICVANLKLQEALTLLHSTPLRDPYAMQLDWIIWKAQQLQDTYHLPDESFQL